MGGMKVATAGGIGWSGKSEHCIRARAVQNESFGFVGLLPINSTGLAGRSVTVPVACAFKPQPSFFCCLTFLVIITDIQTSMV